jgi:hypothetical protein
VVVPQEMSRLLTREAAVHVGDLTLLAGSPESAPSRRRVIRTAIVTADVGLVSECGMATPGR